ncbi:MAG: Hint domain-containing protein [Rhodobacter sp.]|nr:Hint domain-containing protein [Rhodobacter sp.]
MAIAVQTVPPAAQAAMHGSDHKPGEAVDAARLTGFAPMTRISTSFGEVYAQALRKGDLVRTRTGGFLPIVWLDRILLDAAFLARHPAALPIQIRQGSLASGTPLRTIEVAPAQRLAAMHGVATQQGREASNLLAHPGVFRKPETGLSYTRFHLGRRAEVRSEGVWLITGPD